MAFLPDQKKKNKGALNALAEDRCFSFLTIRAATSILTHQIITEELQLDNWTHSELRLAILG